MTLNVANNLAMRIITTVIWRYMPVIICIHNKNKTLMSVSVENEDQSLQGLIVTSEGVIVRPI